MEPPVGLGRRTHVDPRPGEGPEDHPTAPLRLKASPREPRALGRCSVLLAVRHALYREALRIAVEERMGSGVTIEAADGATALEAFVRHKPTVSVVEWDLPALSGVEFLRHVRAESPRASVVLLAEPSFPDVIAAAIRLCVDGCIERTCNMGDFTSALSAAAAGRTYYGPAITEHIVRMAGLPGSDSGPNASWPLTHSEQQILKMVAEGLSSKEIGASLCRSPRTVDYHRHNIMRKLGIRDLPSLTRYAIRLGIASL